MKRLLLLALLATLISCKKNTSVKPSNKGLLVSTHTFSYGNNNDLQAQISAYTYDDKNRIIKKTVAQTDNNVTEDVDTFYYSYDNDNNFIKLVESGTYYAAFTYNIIYANGVPSYCTLTNNSDTVLYAKYTVENNHVTRIDYSGNFVKGGYETITYSNNNLNNLTTVSPTVTALNYTFGTKNGPFKNCTLKWFLGLLGDDLDPTEYSENDMLTSTGSGEALTLENTYNSEGYVTKSITHNSYNTYTYSDTYTYVNMK